eukprot:1391819-Amorphochlora_amoeboformis.AAC.2
MKKNRENTVYNTYKHVYVTRPTDHPAHPTFQALPFALGLPWSEKLRPWLQNSATDRDARATLRSGIDGVAAYAVSEGLCGPPAADLMQIPRRRGHCREVRLLRTHSWKPGRWRMRRRGLRGAGSGLGAGRVGYVGRRNGSEGKFCGKA